MKNINRRAGDFAALLTAGLLTLGLLSALVAQLVFKIAPCPLCLQQRWPYFIGIPLAIGITQLAKGNIPGNILRCAEVALLAVLGWSLFLSLHHSGIEWGFWPAPVDCVAATQPIADIDDLQEQIKNYKFVPCDQPAWKLFGLLSFANLNALLSGFLFVLNALVLAGYDLRRLYGSKTVSQ